MTRRWTDTVVRGAACAATSALALGVALTPAMAQSGVRRIGGTNRYDTMARLVEEGFSSSAWAVVSTGENFPDALAASALAGLHDCPIILTSKGSLDAHASTKLKDLGVQNVILMGGPNTVSTEVQTAIADMGIDVTRIAGTSRSHTSVAALAELKASGAAIDTVILATGNVFADTLSIGPWSYAKKAPIVLVESGGSLSAEAVSAITSVSGLKNVIIVGGTNSVSENVKDQLGATYTYQRLGGADRYETSSAITTWSVAHGLTWRKPAFATGQNFPDALAGAALSGANGSPLLLVSGPKSVTVGLFNEHAAEAGCALIFGGTASVSSEVAQALGPTVPYDQSAGKITDEMVSAAASWPYAYLGFTDDGTYVYLSEAESKNAAVVLLDTKANTYLRIFGTESATGNGRFTITDDYNGSSIELETMTTGDGSFKLRILSCLARNADGTKSKQLDLGATMTLPKDQPSVVSEAMKNIATFATPIV